MAQGEAHRYRFSVSLPPTLTTPIRARRARSPFCGRPPATRARRHAHADPAGVDRRGHRHHDARSRHDRRGPDQGHHGRRHGQARRDLHRRARQKGTGGKVSGTVICAAACRVSVSGIATSGSLKVKLPTTVKRTLKKGKRLRVTLTLPARARLALAGGRPVTIRLKLTAKVGTRVVTVRRTVRIAPAAR